MVLGFIFTFCHFYAQTSYDCGPKNSRFNSNPEPVALFVNQNFQRLLRYVCEKHNALDSDSALKANDCRADFFIYSPG